MTGTCIRTMQALSQDSVALAYYQQHGIIHVNGCSLPASDVPGMVFASFGSMTESQRSHCLKLKLSKTVKISIRQKLVNLKIDIEYLISCNLVKCYYFSLKLSQIVANSFLCKFWRFREQILRGCKNTVIMLVRHFLANPVYAAFNVFTLDIFLFYYSGINMFSLCLCESFSL